VGCFEFLQHITISAACIKRRVTPAMEAGLTDHVWMLEELVTLFRSQVERDCGMTISTNIVGWFRLLLLASGAAYLWRSGLSPRKGEPKSPLDRGLRIFGAILLSAVAIYFVGFGLGLYGSN